MATTSVNESSSLLGEMIDEMLYRHWIRGDFPDHMRPRDDEEWAAWEVQLERGRKIAERIDLARIEAELTDELERIGRKAA
jgi:hypothetical protein